MSNAYVDIEDIKRYAWEFSEQDLALFDPLRTRASRIFDIMCYVPAGHFLTKTVEAENRTFYGSSSVYLMLPPHYEPVVEVTMPSAYNVPKWVEIDGDLRVTDDDGILISPFVGNTILWPSNVPITVKAKWGYEAVPEDVKEAVIELSIAMFRSKDQAFLKAINLENNTVLVKDTPERTKMVAAFYNNQKNYPAFV